MTGRTLDRWTLVDFTVYVPLGGALEYFACRWLAYLMNVEPGREGLFQALGVVLYFILATVVFNAFVIDRRRHG